MKTRLRRLAIDLGVAFFWSLVLFALVCAPGVFSTTTRFVYTVF